MDKKNFSLLLNEAIIALEEKYATSNEEVIEDYIVGYKKVLSNIHQDNAEEYVKEIGNLCRAYFETTSVYDQEFLRKMSAVEEYISKVILSD